MRARMDSPARADEYCGVPVGEAICFVANIPDFSRWCGQLLDAWHYSADITVFADFNDNTDR